MNGLCAVLAILTVVAADGRPQAKAAAGEQPPQKQEQGRNLDDFQKNLDRINAQIKDLRSKLQSERKRESSVLAELSRINLTRDLLRRELAAENLQLRRARTEQAELTRKSAGIRTRLDREKADIQRTLVTLYKYGRLSFLQFILRAESMDAVFAESKQLGLLARHQEKILNEYLGALAQLRATETLLQAKTAEAAARIRTAEEKRAGLEAEEKKNRALVERIQSTRESYEQTIGELDESARQLQALMKRLLAQEFAWPESFTPIYEKRGRLPWPIPARRILTAFGLQKHPRFNTTVQNNGIEIEPRPDETAVTAVHTGRVVYADGFEGYGNLLILDHGMSYYTLYGHCAEFLVDQGDVVKAGRPIALVGDTGSLKGTCLYFEVRFKTRALDPLLWLQRMVK